MLDILALGAYISIFSYILFSLKKDSSEFLWEIEASYPKKLIIAGLLTAITVAFHLAPVFLPGVGLALSPLSTLLIIVGVLIFKERALLIFLAAVIMLLFTNIKESVIFLLTTGPLGFTVALIGLDRKK